MVIKDNFIGFWTGDSMCVIINHSLELSHPYETNSVEILTASLHLPQERLRFYVFQSTGKRSHQSLFKKKAESWIEGR